MPIKNQSKRLSSPQIYKKKFILLLQRWQKFVAVKDIHKRDDFNVINARYIKCRTNIQRKIFPRTKIFNRKRYHGLNASPAKKCQGKTPFIVTIRSIILNVKGNTRRDSSASNVMLNRQSPYTKITSSCHVALYVSNTMWINFTPTSIFNHKLCPHRIVGTLKSIYGQWNFFPRIKSNNF